jgi:DNA invertase Pin-like site-specific DNA recombinase
MKISYARVSLESQGGLNGQLTELAKVCGEKVLTEVASGGRWDRPVLQEILRTIKEGDVLVVYKLDRLTRSLSDLLQILTCLEKRKAQFQSLTENIDTTSAGGRMMMQMLGVFAEFERAMIRERTKLGIAQARALGRAIGRPGALDSTQIKEALRMVEQGRSQAEVGRVFKVHRSIINRLVKEQRILAK